MNLLGYMERHGKDASSFLAIKLMVKLVCCVLLFFHFYAFLSESLTTIVLDKRNTVGHGKVPHFTFFLFKETQLILGESNHF
ncbi:Serine--tRNA ligase [Dirofilaria immitis]